jgi:hypothetical protein
LCYYELKKEECMPKGIGYPKGMAKKKKAKKKKKK